MTSTSMPLFWGIAALFAAIAIAFVLVPLFRGGRKAAQVGRRAVNIAVYRDQLHELERDRRDGTLGEEQYAAARLEIEARLAQDALHEADTAAAGKGGKALGLVLGAAIPAAAFGLYMLFGNPAAIVPGPAAQHAGAGAHNIANMVQALEEKAQANPQDANLQLLLAKTYSAMDRWPDAMRAFEQVIRLAPREAAALSGYAEALAVSAGRNLQGRPLELIRQALEIDPNDAKALELAGIDAYQEGRYAQAAGYWERLIGQLPPDSPYARDIAGIIEDAKAKAGLGGGAKPEGQKPAAAGINGRIELAETLRGKAPADAVLFLFARSLDGAGPPLAALKGKAGELPLSFTLDDTMAMNPNNRLSGHPQVALVARISLSGQPQPASGDLEGSLSPVKLGSRDVRLVIDKVRP